MVAFSVYIYIIQGNTLALGASTDIIYVIHINTHTSDFISEMTFMLMEECGMLLFYSFLYLVVEYRNCFKMTQIVNYDLATSIWE